MSALLSADVFLELGPVRWTLSVLIGAMLTGTLFMPLYRWSDQYEQRSGATAEPGAERDVRPGS